jgi:hypothetical protein
VNGELQTDYSLTTHLLTTHINFICSYIVAFIVKKTYSQKTGNMKSKLLCLLLLITVFASGCYSDKSAAPAPEIPVGTFAGQFRLVHTTYKTGMIDTLSANIQLTMNTSLDFSVTGDTSTVHAGSHGAYATSGNYIQFNDVTYPKTGIPVKAHLEGVYAYYYDGSIFQMVANSPFDTLSYQYDLKKVN